MEDQGRLCNVSVMLSNTPHLLPSSLEWLTEILVTATRAAGVAEDPFIISAQSLNRPALVHACGSAHTLPLYPFANVQPTLPSTVLPAPSSKNEDRSSLIPILPAPPPSTQIHIVYFSSSDIL